MVLAGASARLDGEVAFALGAIGRVAFDGDGFAEDGEVGGGRGDFATVGGFVTEADDAAGAFVFHAFLRMLGNVTHCFRILVGCVQRTIVTEEGLTVTPITSVFDYCVIETSQRIVNVSTK